ncbi:MAG: precorrin-8X methylmutase, partial [Chloroflexota bacterium]
MSKYETDPTSITEQSFAMIQAELSEMGVVLDPAEAPIVERMIHTTADFDFAKITVITPGGIAAGVKAL